MFYLKVRSFLPFIIFNAKPWIHGNLDSQLFENFRVVNRVLEDMFKDKYFAFSGY